MFIVVSGKKKQQQSREGAKTAKADADRAAKRTQENREKAHLTPGVDVPNFLTQNCNKFRTFLKIGRHKFFQHSREVFFSPKELLTAQSRVADIQIVGQCSQRSRKSRGFIKLVIIIFSLLCIESLKTIVRTLTTPPFSPQNSASRLARQVSVHTVPVANTHMGKLNSDQ